MKSNKIKIILRIALVLGFIYFLKNNFVLEDIYKIGREFYPVYFILFVLTSLLMLVFRGYIWITLIGFKVRKTFKFFQGYFPALLLILVTLMHGFVSIVMFDKDFRNMIKNIKSRPFDEGLKKAPEQQ